MDLSSLLQNSHSTVESCITCSDAQAFRSGTNANHLNQVSLFIYFFQHYHLQFLNPSASTLCHYITFLMQRVISPKNMRNCVSGIMFLHREIGLTPAALGSFQVTCTLRAADLIKRTSLHQYLPVLSHLIQWLCTLSSSVGDLGPTMKKCVSASGSLVC